MSWTERRSELETLARSVDSAARLKVMPSWWGNRVAMTIGPWILIPGAWTPEMAESVIVHEATHVQQYRWCGLGIHPWVGLIPFWALYFLVFLPVGLAWVRYRFELAANEAQWTHNVAMSEDAPSLAGLLAEAVYKANRVSGLPYFFSIPCFWARWGYRRAAERAFRVGRARLLTRFRAAPRSAKRD